MCLQELSEDEKIRLQCENRERYQKKYYFDNKNT